MYRDGDVFAVERLREKIRTVYACLRDPIRERYRYYTEAHYLEALRR